MKKALTLTWMILSLAAMPLATSACSGDDDDGNTDGTTDDGTTDDGTSDDGTTDDGTDDGAAPVCAGDNVVDVTEDITTDTTWTAENVYCLNTHIFVTDATLTIEPGTLIQGGTGSSLVVTTTGLLDAEGTADAPIVFTSAQPEGNRAAGDWGGVVLLGLATINVKGGTNVIEGFPTNTPGIEYGGDDDTHNCGALTYVRIEFAGFELAPDNELNGLTVGGCGSDTVLDFIQSHMGADDGVEFFGGLASISHLVVTQPDDDGLDWDFGWAGNGQFIIVQQNPDVGNHGFEADNNADDVTAQPNSNPNLWNIDLIGSGVEPGTAGKTQGGMMLRRGTQGSINNAIVAFFTDFAINIDEPETAGYLEGGDLAVVDSFVFENAGGEDWPADIDTVAGDETTDDIDEAVFFNDNAVALGLSIGTDPALTDPLNLDAPDFLPIDLSPVLGAGATPPADDFFDPTATFIGAIGDDDWTAGWTAYPAN
jgi:hypothetical protein